jgi:hypothetical protein
VNELLDVVTRVYEYQRAYPTLVGTASGLETVRLVLQGKLPTPPIIATLGISSYDINSLNLFRLQRFSGCLRSDCG